MATRAHPHLQAKLKPIILIINNMKIYEIMEDPRAV